MCFARIASSQLIKRLVFQSLLLARAKEELEQEMEKKEEQKANYLDEKTPPIEIAGMSLDDLKVEDHSDRRAVHT